MNETSAPRSDALPPLPVAKVNLSPGIYRSNIRVAQEAPDCPLYTADQMREYARATLAQAPAQPVADERDRERAYDKLDHFLRCNLDDADYAEYSDAMETLWAAPSPSPIQPGWQPIETAPKDGTRVILAWDSKSINGFYLDNSLTKTPWAGWRVESMVPQPAGRPTHWMPLPASPAETAPPQDEQGRTE